MRDASAFDGFLSCPSVRAKPRPHALMPSCPHALMPSCPHALMPSCPHALMPSCPHAPCPLRPGPQFVANVFAPRPWTVLEGIATGAWLPQSLLEAHSHPCASFFAAHMLPVLGPPHKRHLLVLLEYAFAGPVPPQSMLVFMLSAQVLPQCVVCARHQSSLSLALQWPHAKYGILSRLFFLA
jgi:hypothetical protein